MLNIKVLFIIFSILFFSNTLFGQIKVIDQVSRKISVLNENSRYEFRIDEIENKRLKITFRSDTANYLNKDFGSIYIKSYNDLKELKRLIITGLDEKKDQSIHLDLGDSQLTLTFVKQLLGGTIVKFTHSYINNPYVRKSSKYLSRSDIEKLFIIPTY